MIYIEFFATGDDFDMNSVHFVAGDYACERDAVSAVRHIIFTARSFAAGRVWNAGRTVAVLLGADPDITQPQAPQALLSHRYDDAPDAVLSDETDAPAFLPADRLAALGRALAA